MIIKEKHEVRIADLQEMRAEVYKAKKTLDEVYKMLEYYLFTAQGKKIREHQYENLANPKNLNAWRGNCPTCHIRLSSNDMPFGKYCPYCDNILPFESCGLNNKN